MRKLVMYLKPEDVAEMNNALYMQEGEFFCCIAPLIEVAGMEFPEAIAALKNAGMWKRETKMYINQAQAEYHKVHNALVEHLDRSYIIYQDASDYIYDKMKPTITKLRYAHMNELGKVFKIYEKRLALSELYILAFLVKFACATYRDYFSKIEGTPMHNNQKPYYHIFDMKICDDKLVKAISPITINIDKSAEFEASQQRAIDIVTHLICNDDFLNEAFTEAENNNMELSKTLDRERQEYGTWQRRTRNVNDYAAHGFSTCELKLPKINGYKKNSI